MKKEYKNFFLIVLSIVIASCSSSGSDSSVQISESIEISANDNSSIDNSSTGSSISSSTYNHLNETINIDYNDLDYYEYYSNCFIYQEKNLTKYLNSQFPDILSECDYEKIDESIFNNSQNINFYNEKIILDLSMIGLKNLEVNLLTINNYIIYLTYSSIKDMEEYYKSYLNASHYNSIDGNQYLLLENYEKYYDKNLTGYFIVGIQESKVEESIPYLKIPEKVNGINIVGIYNLILGVELSLESTNKLLTYTNNDGKEVPLYKTPFDLKYLYLPDTIEFYCSSIWYNGHIYMPDENSSKYLEIKYIHIPERLRYLPYYAFYSYKNLEEVSSIKNIEYIGHSTFNNTSIHNVDFSKDLEYIEDCAFQSTTIHKVDLSNCNKLKRIPKKCFQSLNSKKGITVIFYAIIVPINITLFEVSLPEGLEEIDDYAFYGCIAVKFTNFPSSIKRIGEDTFYYASLYYPDSYKSYNGLVLYNGWAVDYDFEDDQTDLIIPKGINGLAKDSDRCSIELYTDHFPSYKNINRIIIEDGVNNIPYNAFYGRNDYKTIIIKGNNHENIDYDYLRSICEKLIFE